MTEALRSHVGVRSLFDRLGGERGIALLVDAFYERVLGDPELSGFFQHSSMDRLRRMQREFFCAAVGGPARYSGRLLGEAHYGMGLRTRHLARFVRHLFATLRALDIDEQDTLDIVSRINSYAREITGEPR